MGSSIRIPTESEQILPTETRILSENEDIE